MWTKSELDVTKNAGSYWLRGGANVYVQPSLLIGEKGAFRRRYRFVDIANALAQTFFRLPSTVLLLMCVALRNTVSSLSVVLHRSPYCFKESFSDY